MTSLAAIVTQKYHLFALLILCAFASLSSGANYIENRHEQWMTQYGRVYKDEAEKSYRLKIFQANVEYIESFNSAGKHKYKLGTNQFADQTNKEFKAAYNGFKPSKAKGVTIEGKFKYANFSAAPASIDWRTKGAVTPSWRNQQHLHNTYRCSAYRSKQRVDRLLNSHISNQLLVF